MTDRDDKPKADEPEIPFVDKKGMFGTSPIDKELTDEEVAFLTSRTAPRVSLTRSKRKIVRYIGVFLILFFALRIIFYRTAPITGLAVPPVLGMGEIGLLLASIALAGLNWFMLTPEDRPIRHLVRALGTWLPLVILGVIYLLPPQKLYDLTRVLYP